MDNRKNQTIADIYRKLLACFGPQHWWPGETPFEVMVGAILTQSASWHNVEKAIDSLKQAGALSPKALRQVPLSDLAGYVHSSGYYNAKAKKLKALVEWLGNYEDSLEKAFSGNLDDKRNELLGIHGIGPETADSILLYAAGKPAFVIDAYTRRIAERIGIAPQRDTYDAYQRLFMSNLEQDTRLFNEYHALFVKLGKDVCRKKPLCSVCCLKEMCSYGREH
ncbi:MAG: endonuclease III domain-containing protein [Dehalococcoidia bacterium]|nr:MAG: endonuclease III domain-containing protein [Dehalococcoidia bacterium]